jgi:hypothetical protein
MLCTDCFETSHPQTLLDGSDRLEMLGWLCLFLPGWLYCAWRHALRTKACGVCGGTGLVRESRAAAARCVPLAGRGAQGRVRNLHGPVRWTRPFTTPRERLTAGAPGALAALFAALLAAADLPQPVASGGSALSGAALAAIWLGCGTRLWLGAQRGPGACRAWTPDGREIHIELA